MRTNILWKVIKLFFIHGKNPSFCSFFQEICHALKRTRPGTIAESRNLFRSPHFLSLSSLVSLHFLHPIDRVCYTEQNKPNETTSMAKQVCEGRVLRQYYVWSIRETICYPYFLKVLLNYHKAVIEYKTNFCPGKREKGEIWLIWPCNL